MLMQPTLVQLLARVNPARRSGGHITGAFGILQAGVDVCFFCNRTCARRELITTDHSPDCLWRMAVEGKDAP